MPTAYIVHVSTEMSFTLPTDFVVITVSHVASNRHVGLKYIESGVPCLSSFVNHFT